MSTPLCQSAEDLILTSCSTSWNVRGGGLSTTITYVWFDTGLEYAATKEHVRFLEAKYRVEILRYRAEKPIPTVAREYGQPFLSKYVSQNISRLQRHGFQWEDEPFDVLAGRYGNCVSALKWFTNGWTRTGQPGHFDIGRTPWLREFLIESPPTFKISDKCCEYAKKRVAQRAISKLRPDVELLGIRKAEGGIRASSFSTCYDRRGGHRDYNMYRPIFWFNDATKRAYEEAFGVTHSRCYSEYGFKRTGCACCPFGRDFDHELDMIAEHEPAMHKAASNIFAESYEYTRAFRQYQREHKTGQLMLDLRHARGRHEMKGRPL